MEPVHDFPLSLSDSFRAVSIHLFHDQQVTGLDAVALADLSLQTYLIYFVSVVVVGC